MRNVRREMAVLAALVIAAAPTPSPKDALLTVSFSRTTRAATVRVAVVGATLAEPGAVIRPREGHAHLHYRLDQGSVLCTTATTMTFRELSGGMHTVTVSLAGDDHKELGPRQVIPINIADDIKDVHSTSPELGVLASIPYLQSVPSGGETGGIAVHKEGSASPGYNLYSSRDEGTVVLMDMRGRVLHRWSLPPGGEKGYWSWAHLLPNGDLIALLNERALVKVDKDSRVLWTYKGEVHHDVSVDQSGNIYTLTRAARIVPAIHPRIPTLADAITILSANGVTKGEISLIDALRETPYRFLLPSLGGLTLESSVSSLDVVHTNRVEVFDGRLAARSPLFAKGNLLVGMRNLNAVAIIDGSARKVVWIWGPTNLVFPHNPTLLDNGNILLFNNGIKKSEVLELNPFTYEVVWRYTPRDLFSISRGRVQRLPNGNTLIVSNSQGYAVEVTPAQEVVWKFVNPDVDEKGERGILSVFTRYGGRYIGFGPSTDTP